MYRRLTLLACAFLSVRVVPTARAAEPATFEVERVEVYAVDEDAHAPLKP